MKLFTVLTLCCIPALASAQGYPRNVQYEYAGSTPQMSQISPQQQRAGQPWYHSRPAQFARGAATVYGQVSGAVRPVLGAPVMIMITPPGGYNYASPGARVYRQ